MLSGSILRPLLVYSLFFCLGLAIGVVTLASLALVRSVRTAAIEAATEDARQFARRAEWPELSEIAARERGEVVDTFGVVGPGSPALGLSIEEARVLARARGDLSGAVRVAGEGPEAYVVYRIEPRSFLLPVQREIQRLLLGALMIAALVAVVLSLLVGRVVLAPLRDLNVVAADVALLDPLTAAENETPHEVADVAKTFRRTLRKLHEERQRIEQQRAELEAMNAQLLRASKLAGVGRLAAGVAHEIGNPLAALLGYLSLVKRGLGAEETQDILDRSIKELNRIHETIRKLLAYARADEGTEPLAPIASGIIVADALTLVRGHPSLRGVEVVSELEPRELVDAIGRPRALEQVMINLLVNAGQATAEREGAQVVVRRTHEPQAVIISVADNGPGIPLEIREQIFDPFFTTKPVGEGTGLGLAVSRSLVEAMKGELSVQSEPGGGATFTLRLPKATNPY